MREPLIGRSVPRKEARAKVTGQARYVDDMRLPGMLHGVTVRSPAPRGRIRGIRFDPDIPWHDFVVVTARDVPGLNSVALIEDDQPFLAGEVVNHREEPVVLLAHADRWLLEEARRAVSIDIEPLPPVFALEESLGGQTIVWGRDNVFKRYEVERGEVDAAFGSAAVVVEGEYETGAQEQLYIEPNGMVAVASAEVGVTVWGSMQCPYYVQRGLMQLFGLPADRVRIVQMETGGGFGGKEEYPTLVAGHAALLAWKSGRPVKLVYDRAEDMAATTKRHPSKTRHRTAIDKDGRLQAMEIDFTIDGGAYCTLSPVVLSRGTIHAAGPYFCPNVRLRSRAVATNAPPHGAFRGFGAPQSVFALERHMNQVAAAAGLTPEEFRKRNFIRPGQRLAVGQVVKDAIDMTKLLDRALELSDYRRRREIYRAARHADGAARGIGFATFMHGAGFTGSGEEHLQSVVAVEATREGHVRVLASNVEMGQGTNTVFAQIAGDALHVPPDFIEVAQPDTLKVPNSGPTVASRTCMVVGRLVEEASVSLRQKLLDAALLRAEYSPAEFRDACLRYQSVRGPLHATSTYRPPPGLSWDEEKYQGDAYGSYAWAAYVADVRVDLVTFETRVTDFVAVQEVGRVINPVLAAGQIEGGVAQGIGYALYEQVVWRDGRMENAQMTNYIMPTSMDVPPIRVHFEEQPYAYGPAGAKGIGELPLDGVAPAVANAIESAVGVKVDRIPATPEALM
ncbi:MAG TPA: xanthine dehydrogenase family protein molybdopterin-binding subunit, partial [Vicinamibacterales bacterium]|nr:xanthine dehydrogenase family protein molybdopterin-binding subunit [Vicinamibacterales bacterium]